MDGDARERAMHGLGRARIDAHALSSHAWMETRASKPCMAGGWARIDASVPSSHAWMETRVRKPCMAGGGLALMHMCGRAMHGWRRARASHAWMGGWARIDAHTLSSHAWMGTRASKPCMAGGWARIDASAPSSHAWMETRVRKPCMAGGGLALMHMCGRAMHGWRRARASHAWMGGWGRIDASAPSSHAWMETCVRKPCMAGGWGRIDASAPSSHVWMETRVRKPCMARPDP